MEDTFNLQIGQRLLINQEKCSIKWIGQLPEVTGERIGLEWDNFTLKGKHSGDYQGQQYFKTKIPQSASFIKRPRTISQEEGVVQVGISLLQAIKERYLGSSAEDIQVALSSQPKVKIETRGWDKVQKQLGQTSRLRIVSVCDTKVSTIDIGADIIDLLPALEELDLSRTLIWNWCNIMQLCCNYSSLTTLRLDENRLQSIPIDNNFNSFDHLVTLTLNGCLFTNNDVNNVAPYLTKLKILQLSTNQLKCIPFPVEIQEEKWFPQLETLVLSDNLIVGVDCKSLSGIFYFKRLKYLDLSYNPLTHLCFDTQQQSSELSISLERLNINYGKINDWSQLGKICKLFPNLLHLQALENPGILDPSGLIDVKIGLCSIARIALIAMNPTITQLNMTLISNQERTDAELFYLHQICQPNLTTLSPETFEATHFQYNQLCKKYDITHTSTKPLPDTAAIKNRLLSLQLVLHDNFPPTQSDSLSTDTILEVTPLQQTSKQFLRSANVRTLQLTIKKMFKLSPTTPIELYGLIPFTSSTTPQLYQIVPLDNPVRELHQFYQLNDNDIVWVTLK